MVIVRTSSDPVASINVPCPGTLGACIERKHQGSVGELAANPESVDCTHGLDPESSCTALISQRAVDETVRKDPFAPFERGTDGFCNVVGACCGKEQGLGLRAPAVILAVQ